MIRLSDYLYEAELNLEWWNSKSPSYQKRYLSKHPNSIYANKVKSGELEEPGETPKAKPKSKLEKLPSQYAAADERIAKWTGEKDRAIKEYNRLKDERSKLPDVIKIGDYGTDNATYYLKDRKDDTPNYTQEELADFWTKRNDLTTKMHYAYIEYDNAKHNLEVAERYKKRLHFRENFEKRLIGPNTTDKYKESGIAEYVDFSGMDHDTEEEAMNSVIDDINRFPFMKNHLTFVGSHKSNKFKELSQQLAHDYYYDEVAKEYDEAKKYIHEHKTGYSDWELDRRKRLVDAVDRHGGIEGYIRTPAYQRAMKRWEKMSSRWWAFYRTDTLKDGQKGMISFNENNFDEADLKHNVEVKWHPEGCDTKKSVLDHEFAHAIWYKLGLNKKMSKGDQGFYGELSPLQKYIKDKMWMGKEHVSNNLSRYATTNPSEFFAEALSEYLNNPHPRKIATDVWELLQQEIKDRGLK